MILSTSVSAKFNASGKAVVTTGPTRNNQAWRITRITTIINSSNGSELLRLYRSSETPSNYLDGSKQAAQDVSETNITLSSLETMLFVWSGGTPGNTAYATITGEII